MTIIAFLFGLFYSPWSRPGRESARPGRETRQEREHTMFIQRSPAIQPLWAHITEHPIHKLTFDQIDQLLQWRSCPRSTPVSFEDVYRFLARPAGDHLLDQGETRLEVQ